jgi:ABC-2 type transport system ATP-binding protein
MQRLAEPVEIGTSLALSVSGLSKRYGALQAVDGVSFEVRTGETFGLLGPNGAGKTTTLEMIEGLRSPDAGEITLLGLDAVKERRQVQEQIGVQLQTQGLWPDLTVEETLKTFAAIFGRSVSIDEIIERMSLAEKRRSLVRGLSGGQKQRLSLATALINDPDIIFLDEPTTGLDPAARQSFWDLIRNLRTGGKTLIVTTHYMEEAEVLCDRVAIMDGGRIMAMDTPRALIRNLSFDDTVECTFTDGVEDNALRNLPAVRDVTSEDESVLLFTDDVSATLEALMQVRDSAGERVKSLHVRTATLEDVFISLTGRRLES